MSPWKGHTGSCRLSSNSVGTENNCYSMVTREDHASVPWGQGARLEPRSPARMYTRIQGSLTTFETLNCYHVLKSVVMALGLQLRCLQIIGPESRPLLGPQLFQVPRLSCCVSFLGLHMITNWMASNNRSLCLHSSGDQKKEIKNHVPPKALGSEGRIPPCLSQLWVAMVS